MQFNASDANLVFNGSTNTLKFFFINAYKKPELRHAWTMHDVGVGNLAPGDSDAYGHLCRIPPGEYYTLGHPQACGPSSDDGQAYGWWFTPINDNAAGSLAKYGRAGLGLHGGGTGLASPFGPQQGWEDTFGCGRLQNEDNGMEVPAPGTLVNSLQYVFKAGGKIYFSVYWP